MRNLTLFHATNKGAAEKAFLNGLGVGRAHYESLASLIADHYPIVTSKDLMRYFDTQSSESNEGVSFLPSKKKSRQIAKAFSNGGEWINLFIKQSLKLVARRLKVPYRTLDTSEFRSILLGDLTPVVVEALVPLELIANPERIGTGVELYTLQKVPSSCLVRMWPVVQ